MNTERSELELESVWAGYPYGVLRSVLLGFAIVSVVLGLRHVLRGIYRFHMWNS
ncbi:MAG TPA: hypothetical protein VK206_00930 [Anaerolineales bacterium]|nr:hypothetical protein [Anaerolineales bacterium]HLO31198.1 hypothetical protein [Anaerolineales bacterium]